MIAWMPSLPSTDQESSPTPSISIWSSSSSSLDVAQQQALCLTMLPPAWRTWRSPDILDIMIGMMKTTAQMTRLTCFDAFLHAKWSQECKEYHLYLRAK
ncbi:uncharacterized protein UTRI_05396 [Ustilago trichophora]|uniref:Uncharacterized protein n=1 Tax=Ustilago trichophora TaxID=86804 RepID=A0A5C3ENK1_9BASI|nr:uncharacterized protein UTRI_05396 [Ustilago trichophora]